MLTDLKVTDAMDLIGKTFLGARNCEFCMQNVLLYECIAGKEKYIDLVPLSQLLILECSACH